MYDKLQWCISLRYIHVAKLVLHSRGDLVSIVALLFPPSQLVLSCDWLSPAHEAKLSVTVFDPLSVCHSEHSAGERWAGLGKSGQVGLGRGGWGWRKVGVVGKKWVGMWRSGNGWGRGRG